MNGSTLARFGIGALISCCLAPAAALADTPTLNPSGTLTFSWRGDPARGCQAAGVCDVSGSLEVIPEDLSGSRESPPSRDIRIEDDGAVVRVNDPGSTPSEPHICTQLMPVDGFVTVRQDGGGLQGAGQWFSVPSSGDCAGPLAESFGAFSLPARRLPGRTEAYDLSGTRTFGSGPYTVTLKSSLRARRPPGGGPNGVGIGGGSGTFPSPKQHKALVEQVSMQYRVTVTGGPFTTTFAGRPDPLCVPLDACGASGVVKDAVSGTSNRLQFDAQRIVKRRVSRRGVLADLRSGHLVLFDAGALLANAQSANVRWPDGSTCTDQLRQVNAVGLNATGARHQKLLFSLAAETTDDPLRSACPGPGAADVLGEATTLATASLPLKALGRSSLRLTLSGQGRFVAGSYAGSRSGGVTVALRLVRLSAGTKAEDVFPGEP